VIIAVSTIFAFAVAFWATETMASRRERAGKTLSGSGIGCRPLKRNATNTGKKSKDEHRGPR
jgi:hypothetical protein